MVDFPLSNSADDFDLQPDQDLVLRDDNGNERLRLDAAAGTLRVRSSQGESVIRLDGGAANLMLGAHGKDGDLLLYPQNAVSHGFSSATIHLNSDGASVTAGNNSKPGVLRINGANHRVEATGDNGTLTLSGRLDIRTAGGALIASINDNGDVIAGGAGQDGLVRVRDGNNKTTILLNGANGDARIGGDGENGLLELRDANDALTITLNGTTGNLALGDNQGGNAGALFVKDAQGNDSAVINGNSGNMGLGSNGNGGALFIKDNAGQDTLVLNGETGNIGLGRNGREGNLFVKNDQGQNTIHLSGQTGDILLANADCAEDFNVLEKADLEPGTVMVISEDERLETSSKAYDKRVAGVISGAGAYRPGIVLDRQSTTKNRMPVALMGKVYCKVDASFGAIAVGDLLTTSATPGHAMLASDRDAAFGAVIGKALKPCEAGQAMIPVLIALQ